MKKLFLVIFITLVSFSSITYAISKFNYASALQLANDYIVNSSFDENWKDNNPNIVEQGRNFHTDDDNKTSYIEFKVSCDNNPDCGFIMVNYDGDDVTIPVASTRGNTPSEVLVAQNGGTIGNNNLYYFSPFDMYSKNTKTDDVASINPEDNINLQLNQNKTLTDEEKKVKRLELETGLRDKINQAKQNASDYKKTDEFKNKINDLRDKKQAIPKDEVSYKILPFASAELNQGGNGYVSPGTSDIFIPGASTSNCGSRIPCYNQFTTTYNGSSCYVGCTPVAFGMIYGYYDRQGTYPNLLSGTANSINDSTVNTMIQTVGFKLSTFCSGNEGATYSSNYTNAIQYAKDKGYTSSVATNYSGIPASLFTTIKSEINSNRPIVIHLRSLDGTKRHSVVGYGYKSIGTTPIVRINMGWGYILIPGTTNYYYSNVDYDLNSMYYNNRSGNYADGLTTVRIQ